MDVGLAADPKLTLAMLAQAELCAATGLADDAMALLEEMRAICAPLRAAPTLARAAVLASRLGASPVARQAGLSPREVDVLHLLASGQRNKENAAAHAANSPPAPVVTVMAVKSELVPLVIELPGRTTP